MRLASLSLAILLLVKPHSVVAQALLPACAYQCQAEATTSCTWGDASCYCNDASLATQIACCILKICSTADAYTSHQYYGQACEPYNPTIYSNTSHCPSPPAVSTAVSASAPVVVNSGAASAFRTTTSTNNQPTYKTVNPTSTSESSIVTQPTQTPVGAIIGGVLGGIALIGIILAAIFFVLPRHRREKRNAAQSAANQPNVKPSPSSSTTASPTAPPATLTASQSHQPLNSQQPHHQMPPYAHMTPSPPENVGYGVEMPVEQRHEAYGNTQFYQPMAEMPARN